MVGLRSPEGLSIRAVLYDATVGLRRPTVQLRELAPPYVKSLESMAIPADLWRRVTADAERREARRALAECRRLKAELRTTETARHCRDRGSYLASRVNFRLQAFDGFIQQ
jgi:hypothetical protein